VWATATIASDWLERTGHLELDGGAEGVTYCQTDEGSALAIGNRFHLLLC
jgi:hypothetical protein